MARVHVDVSVFTPNSAYGQVAGVLDLAVVPQVGDIIAFRLSEPIKAYVGKHGLPYGGHVRVTDRIIPVEADCEVLVALEDITTETVDDAKRLMEMLERQHGLLGDVWDE
jgi:hypothetical protein